jgi:DNA uptake protein ComE-like DNA-binding protein
MPQERSGKVNLNNASFEEIAQLPGLTMIKHNLL